MSYSTPPTSNEYAPWAGAYVSRVPEGDIVAFLEKQRDVVVPLLRSISDESSLYRYAPGKWSIREILGHINDAERIFCYRALRIGRGDKTPLPGWEQDDFVKTADADKTPWPALIGEFEAIRRATIPLFQMLPQAAWTEIGTSSNHPFSTRGLAWVLAGHVEHHVAILRERYLPGLA
jgi:hypothetical protein